MIYTIRKKYWICFTDFLVTNKRNEFCFIYMDTACIPTEWGTGNVLLRAATEAQQGLKNSKIALTPLCLQFEKSSEINNPNGTRQNPKKLTHDWKWDKTKPKILTHEWFALFYFFQVRNCKTKIINNITKTLSASKHLDTSPVFRMSWNVYICSDPCPFSNMPIMRALFSVENHHARHFASDYNEKDMLKTWNDQHVEDTTGHWQCTRLCRYVEWVSQVVFVRWSAGINSCPAEPGYALPLQTV